MHDTYAVTHHLPCLNPNCRSHGKPHVNCLCYSAGPGAEKFSEGGQVGFCASNLPHDPDCQYYRSGGAVTEDFHKDPGLAIDHVIAHHGLHHVATRTGKTRSEDPNRPGEDLRDAHDRGKKGLKSLSDGLLDPKHPKPAKEDLEGFKGHIEALQQDPSNLLDRLRTLGESHPEHATELAARLSTASSYLNSIKPKSQQLGPLDRVFPPSKQEQDQYDRQVSIVHNPNKVLDLAKRGMLQPKDLLTVQSVYPKLYQQMKDNAFETLAAHKASGKEVTRKQARVLSAVLGQPLTFTQSSAAARAAMQANAPAQPPTAPNKGKASAVELKQINKVDDLSATSLQDDEIDEKTKN